MFYKKATSLPDSSKASLNDTPTDIYNHASMQQMH